MFGHRFFWEQTLNKRMGKKKKAYQYNSIEQMPSSLRKDLYKTNLGLIEVNYM